MMYNIVLTDENYEQHFCLSSKLAPCSTDVRPSLKNSETIQKLEYGSWKPLRKPFWSHRMFQYKYFLHFDKNLMHTRSVFSAILSAATQTLPFFIYSGMRIRKARRKVPSANRSRHARTRSQGATSLGDRSHRRNTTSLDTFWTALVHKTPFNSVPNLKHKATKTCKFSLLTYNLAQKNAGEERMIFFSHYITHYNESRVYKQSLSLVQNVLSILKIKLKHIQLIKSVFEEINNIVHHCIVIKIN
jgi:hypothetical protein